MTPAGAAVTRFDISSGELRGSHLELHGNCFVHRGGTHLETIPLAALAAVRVEFDRDTRRLGWGVAWLVVALIVLAVAPPLGALAGTAAQEMAAQHASGGTGVAAALLGFFRFAEALARILPLVAAATALAGAAFCALGWIGTTTLTLTLAGGERSYAVRGRNPLLLDFSERLSEQLMAVTR